MADLSAFTQGFREARIDPYLYTSSKKIVSTNSGLSEKASTNQETHQFIRSDGVACGNRKRLAKDFQESKMQQQQQQQPQQARRKSTGDINKVSAECTKFTTRKHCADSHLTGNGINATLWNGQENGVESSKKTGVHSVTGHRNSADHFNSTTAIPAAGSTPHKGIKYMQGPPEFVVDKKAAAATLKAAAHPHVHMVRGSRGSQSSMATVLGGAGAGGEEQSVAKSAVRSNAGRRQSSAVSYNILTGENF